MSHGLALRDARSLLFVPCNRPERFAKVASSGADAVVLDLEDSVQPGDKAAAREQLRARWQQLRDMSVPLVVRVNSHKSEFWELDLDTIASLAGLAAVMVPKSESSGALNLVLVAVVHEALTPSKADLDWARRVLEADAASGGAAVRLDGSMVDAPIVLRARRTLARAAGRGEASA